MVTAENYPVLRKWFAVMFEQTIGQGMSVPDDTHPITILDATALRAPARARDGLRMAINDTLEMITDLPQAEIDRLDMLLSQEALPTVAFVRARFSKVLRGIMKRGRIRTEDEYYLVRNAVEMPAHTDDFEALWRMLEAYEA